MKHLSLILVPLIISGCLFFELSKEEYCDKAWRWDLECALNVTLSEEEIAKVRELSLQLEGRDCAESSWKILEWVEKNIEYDYQKALLPTPIIFTRGKEVIIQNPERTYQTPIETIELGRGICGDYAILIAALLMNVNCSPYVLRFEFQGDEVGHLATAVFLDQYYILDQTLPPMDLGSYYKKWLREGKRINTTYLYDKGLLLGTITPTEMRKFDYKLSNSDLEFLWGYVKKELEKSLLYDPNLPEGYWMYARLRITFQNYAELYTPAFSQKIAEKITTEVLESVEEDKKGWRAFKLELSQSSGDIVVELQLGK